jgi:hypothetical protein
MILSDANLKKKPEKPQIILQSFRLKINISSFSTFALGNKHKAA